MRSLTLRTESKVRITAVVVSQVRIPVIVTSMRCLMIACMSRFFRLRTPLTTITRMRFAIITCFIRMSRSSFPSLGFIFYVGRIVSATRHKKKIKTRTTEFLQRNHRLIKFLLLTHQHLLLLPFPNNNTRISPTKLIHTPERIYRKEEAVNRVSAHPLLK